MRSDLTEMDPARRIARVLQVLKGGSSSPALVETGDGSVYVAKLAGSGAGPHGLFTEYIGSAAAGALGVPVPPAHPLFLPTGLPWQIGTDEFDELIQRSAGWNLGVAYLPEARPLQASELDGLPADFLARLASADRLLQNVDRSAGNPNLLADPAGIWAIDFGSCLFVNRIASRIDQFSFDLPANHFLAGTSANTQPALGALELQMAVAAVASRVKTCPDDWLRALPFGREAFAERFAAYAGAYVSALG